MRTLLICVTVFLPALLAGAEEKAQGAKTAAAQAVPAGVPSGAKQVDEHLWRHQDASGKVWFYRRNPFGVAKFPEEEAKPPAPAAKSAPASSDGIVVDSVADEKARFSKPGPFGTYRWDRKTDELTPEEQVALDQWRAKEAKKPATRREDKE